MKSLSFKPQGVCSSLMEIQISDDNKVESVVVTGGCPGNSMGISSLVVGMDVNDVIARLQGITCGMKPTSCPDQLSKALQQLISK